MSSHEIVQYLDSILSRDNSKRNNEEFQIINDAFELYNINSQSLSGILLLLDDRDIVRNTNKHDRSKKSFVGRSLTLPSKEKIEIGKTLKLDKNRFSIHYLKTSTKEYNKERFSLCFITEEEINDDIEGMLEAVTLKVNKSIELLKRYNQSNNFLLKYLDSIDEGISTSDLNGRITYVNKACCDILGIKKEEIKNGTREISPEYKPILKRIRRDKKSIIDEDYFPKYKKETVHLINSTYPVFNDGKDLIGTIDIFRGIKRSTKLANTLVGQNVSYKFQNIIGESSVLKEKIGLAKSFSLSDANVYIQGESGTGKELFAQSIHNFSKRRNESFVAINCANFPLELVDSELFGYEEGAFTGAKKGGKIGKFELANGGTLFLDEIGEMQLHLQAKLLRVLETRTLFRIGGNKPINIDVKIIAATNRNLYQMVKNGEFREDLYYRLKVLFLEIPPLRDREDDVLLLTDYFIKKIGMGMGKQVKGVNQEGKRLLLRYEWPGNIRELENIVARALFICDGDIITEEDLLKAGIKLEEENAIIKSELKEINKEILIKTLKQTKGNKKKTAEILGLSRPTVYRMIKKYNVKL
ncbi:sigma 54-interacting transcriptional regulator [Wukongibacter baidiensis]|uniref:sigma-54 interaction domain-containing protein n=1 Tax=Wukongibacter baidiensis TaxID=1723361 RepID=UPI003D7FA03B